jgi:hypothetical protein
MLTATESNIEFGCFGLKRLVYTATKQLFHSTYSTANGKAPLEDGKPLREKCQRVMIFSDIKPHKPTDLHVT